MGGTDQGVGAAAASGVPGGVIRTARLTLRAPTPDDARAIFETYASDREVTRYMGWPRHEKLASTEWFVSFAIHEWKTHGVGTHLIFAGEQLVGSTGLHVDTNTRGEVATGYVLGRAYWGQGIATEACRAMVDLARRRGDRRVSAYCHADHAASARVLEKSGLVFEGVLPKHIVFPNYGVGLEDVRLYALDL
jgi:[ribosomal protein S5]-alanine N-acetyltransferase